MTDTDLSPTSGTGTGTAAVDGRQRIMDAAAGSFLRQGFARSSLRQIAAAVGMKAGSLYYHFASKDDLLEAILRRGIAVMVDAFDATEALVRPTAAPARSACDRGADPRRRVEAHVRAHLAALFEHGPYTAAHVSTFHTAPDGVRAAIVPVRDAYEALWAGLLQDLVDDRALRCDIDLGITRLALFGAMNSTIEWFDPEKGSLDHVAAVITEQFWCGVGADGDRP